MTFKLKYFDCDLDEHLQLAIDNNQILFICPKTSVLRLGRLKHTDLGGFYLIEAEIINENDHQSEYDYRPESIQITHRTLFTTVEIE